MIKNTAYGRTDTKTGEIIDLSPLGRKPQGRVSRPKRSTRRKRSMAYKFRTEATCAVVVSIFFIAVQFAQ